MYPDELNSELDHLSVLELSEIIDSDMEENNLGISLQSAHETLSNSVSDSILNVSDGLPQNLGQSLDLNRSCVSEYELGVSLQMDLSD